LDGFFGLFFSGFPDLLLIAGLAPLCGLPLELVSSRIMPAVAFSILSGNLFYAWQAHRLAERTGRTDVTAIPFGVNTPTIFAYVFLIMLPVYQRTHDTQLAWHLGVFACFLSGIVQTAGAFCTDWLRRHTPRAALLCPLAGIAIAFLCLGFVLRIFQTPELALLPTVIILAVYGSRIRLPFRMPGGLLCILAGVILVALLRALHVYHLPAPPPLVALGIHLPRPVNLFEFLFQRCAEPSARAGDDGKLAGLIGNIAGSPGRHVCYPSCWHLVKFTDGRRNACRSPLGKPLHALTRCDGDSPPEIFIADELIEHESRDIDTGDPMRLGAGLSRKDLRSAGQFVVGQNCRAGHGPINIGLREIVLHLGLVLHRTVQEGRRENPPVEEVGHVAAVARSHHRRDDQSADAMFV